MSIIGKIYTCVIVQVGNHLIRGTKENVQTSEVLLFQELNDMQELFVGKERVYFNKKEVSSFQGVLRQRFHHI